MFQVYGSLSQSNYLKLEIRILDKIFKDSEMFLKIFKIMNFSKILLNIAIVKKIFEYFCPFLSSTIITGQRSVSNLWDGLLDICPETEFSFEHFHFEIWKLFF